MKLLLFVTFLAFTAYVSSAKKLLVVGGGGLGVPGGVLSLNGGLVGLNGGLVGLNGGVVGLNGGGLVGLNGGLLAPPMLVGGLNPGLIPAGGVIGQPPFPQMYPAVNPYMLQPPVAPMGLPNFPPQLPPQNPLQANGGAPYIPPVNRQLFTPQQQTVQPQGDMPASPVNRLRRALQLDNSPNSDS